MMTPSHDCRLPRMGTFAIAQAGPQFLGVNQNGHLFMRTGVRMPWHVFQVDDYYRLQAGFDQDYSVTTDLRIEKPSQRRQVGRFAFTRCRVMEHDENGYPIYSVEIRPVHRPEMSLRTWGPYVEYGIGTTVRWTFHRSFPVEDRMVTIPLLPVIPYVHASSIQDQDHDQARLPMASARAYDPSGLPMGLAVPLPTNDEGISAPLMASSSFFPLASARLLDDDIPTPPLAPAVLVDTSADEAIPRASAVRLRNIDVLTRASAVPLPRREAIPVASAVPLDTSADGVLPTAPDVPL